MFMIYELSVIKKKCSLLLEYFEIVNKMFLVYSLPQFTVYLY